MYLLRQLIFLSTAQNLSFWRPLLSDSCTADRNPSLQCTCWKNRDLWKNRAKSSERFTVAPLPVHFKKCVSQADSSKQAPKPMYIENISLFTSRGHRDKVLWCVFLHFKQKTELITCQVALDAFHFSTSRCPAQERQVLQLFTDKIQVMFPRKSNFW